MREETSCGIILARDEGDPRFLLLLYPAGHWGSPKGHVEADEDHRETARRELKEETGIDEVDFIPGFEESITYTYKAGGVRRRKEVIFFLATTTQRDVTLSHEHDDYAWLSYGDAVDRITYDDERAVFVQAREHLDDHDADLTTFL
jgi:8-oxo-dGTP pyrophosphatase MutT (NUDIX family)